MFLRELSILILNIQDMNRDPPIQKRCCRHWLPLACPPPPPLLNTNSLLGFFLTPWSREGGVGIGTV